MNIYRTLGLFLHGIGILLIALTAAIAALKLWFGGAFGVVDLLSLLAGAAAVAGGTAAGRRADRPGIPN